MDELIKALAQALLTGSELAWPALLGYYLASLAETVVETAGFVGCTWLICHTFCVIIRK